MNSNKSISLLTLLVIALGVITFNLAHSKSNLQEVNQNIENKLKTTQSELIETNKEQSELNSKYQALYKEKNGTANEKLIKTTKGFFHAVYDYNSSNQNDSVENRQKKALEFADKNALETILPIDAQNTSPSIKTVSGLTKEPEIYIESTDSDIVHALVLVPFKTTIDGSQSVNNQYMYKIEFDQYKNKITVLSNIGETDKN